MNKRLPKLHGIRATVSTQDDIPPQKFTQFPMEILSCIFILYREPFLIPANSDYINSDSRRSHPAIPWLAPAHVCTKWRQIALGCPTLWNTIHLYSLEAVDFLLQWSQPAALHVVMPAPRAVNGISLPRMAERLEYVMSHNSGRIESLDFTYLYFLHLPAGFLRALHLQALTSLSQLHVGSNILTELLSEETESPASISIPLVTTLIVNAQDIPTWFTFPSLRRLVILKFYPWCIPDVEVFLRNNAQIEEIELGSASMYQCDPPQCHSPILSLHDFGPIICPNLEEVQLRGNVSRVAQFFQLLWPQKISRLTIPVVPDHSAMGVLADLLTTVWIWVGKLPIIQSLAVNLMLGDPSIRFSSWNDVRLLNDPRCSIFSFTFLDRQISSLTESLRELSSSSLAPLLQNVQSARLSMGFNSMLRESEEASSSWLTITSLLPKLTTLDISLACRSQQTLFVALTQRSLSEEFPFPSLRRLILSNATSCTESRDFGRTPPTSLNKSKAHCLKFLIGVLDQRAGTGKAIYELKLRHCAGVSEAYVETLLPFVGEVRVEDGQETKIFVGKLSY
ncbi:hypothetical protein DL96DRAFT_1765764 [Flagelloscypha sp. PMI_526]|nr:hypothetical protein DL96DRAFT_1765764 [Flagelloscypha sp. PMI_526]